MRGKPPTLVVGGDGATLAYAKSAHYICVKKRYTYKLRPGARAESLLNRHAGSCRWVWNTCVERFNTRADTSQTSLMKHLTSLRHSETWLGEQPVVPQQQVIRDFITAKKSFFGKTNGKPKFKSKRATLPSMNYTKRGFSITRDDRLRLAGGITIPVAWSRKLPTEPTSVRVYQDAYGWWWASFVVDADEEVRPRENDGAIGIDWGVKTPATTTDKTFDLGYTPRVKDNAKELAKYQKRMAKHRAGKRWDNYKQAKKKAAKLHRKVKNQRKEQSRQWAQNVAKNHATIAVEDFKPKFLTANTRLAKKASENAIGIVKQELRVAAKTYGCDLILIDPKYTTMDCSNCGARHKAKLELHVRTFTCDHCGLRLDRDVNAARNMLIRAGFNPADVDECKSRQRHATWLSESGIPRL